MSFADFDLEVLECVRDFLAGGCRAVEPSKSDEDLLVYAQDFIGQFGNLVFG